MIQTSVHDNNTVALYKLMHRKKFRFSHNLEFSAQVQYIKQIHHFPIAVRGKRKNILIKQKDWVFAKKDTFLCFTC